MSDVELKRWAETWGRAGNELSALRRRELQAMTDDDIRRAIADLFSGPLPPDLPARATSGLVEQQRLFAVLRRRD